MGVPGAQQLTSEQNKAALALGKVGHSHRSTQGLLSQRNYGGTCQSSPGARKGTFHEHSHFLLTTKPPDIKFPKQKSTWGFSDGTRSRRERVISTLAQGEEPGLELKSHPTPALTLSLVYRKSRGASSQPTNKWGVLPIHGTQQALTKCPRLNDLASGPSSDI